MNKSVLSDVRLYIVRVVVHEDREWLDAINSVGSGKLDGYKVCEVGGKYPPHGGGTRSKDLVLVNFPNGGDWREACMLAIHRGWMATLPRDVFAVAKQHPNLPFQLGLTKIAVVATTKCLLEVDLEKPTWERRDLQPFACCAHLGSTEVDSSARLLELCNFGCPTDWYAFCR